MQPHMLVCALATQRSLAGAEERWCHVCSAAVWVSQSMLPRVEKGAALPTCLVCANGLIPQVASHAVIHPDQVAELRQTGLLGTAHQVVARLNHGARRRKAPFN